MWLIDILLWNSTTIKLKSPEQWEFGIWLNIRGKMIILML